MRIIENPIWVYYKADEEPCFDENKVGKWMYYFGDESRTKKICEAAIEQNIVEECKYKKCNDGVACFYLNDDDMAGHRRVIRFFLENGLIRKTKSGKLHNISFKHDKQTYAGEYGEKYKSNLTLDRFVNLETGLFK